SPLLLGRSETTTPSVEPEVVVAPLRTYSPTVSLAADSRAACAVRLYQPVRPTVIRCPDTVASTVLMAGQGHEISPPPPRVAATGVGGLLTRATRGPPAPPPPPTSTASRPLLIVACDPSASAPPSARAGIPTSRLWLSS